MLKKLVLLAASAALVVSVYACGKQESTSTPAEQTTAPASGQIAVPQKGQEAVVDVPANIKAAWKGIVIVVNNKTDNTSKEYTVDIGGEKKIPGTDLSVKAVEFLPSFVMQGLNITSASNEANNPAAKVVITEGGSEVFKGWLFGKFPETHAFNHPKYSVTLKEGVPAKK
jgi:hypothetical protein